jgi:hypothetical protein
MDQSAQIRAKLDVLQNPPDWIPLKIKESIPKYDVNEIEKALECIEHEYSAFLEGEKEEI